MLALHFRKMRGRSTVVFAFVGALVCGNSARNNGRPLWEPLEHDYFGAEYGMSIPRLQALKNGDWEPLVQKGQPFVVSDCVLDSPLLGFRCADFAQRWPDGRMKAEYSEAATWMRLSDVDWNTIHRKPPGTKRYREHLSNGTSISAPFVWHVKDHEAGEGCYSKKTCWPQKKAIQNLFRAPYFLKESLVNSGESLDSMEIWLTPPGGGTFAHADAYASEIVVSAQLRGVKTWRIMNYPNTSTILDVVESHDSGIYGTGRWSPGHAFDVGPGECLVWPPGYYHESLVRKETNGECAVAATFQFLRPFPTKFLRAFLPRLFHSHLQWQEDGAQKHWIKYATLGMTALGEPTIDETELRRRAKEIMKRADFDRDGLIAQADLEQHLPRVGHPQSVDDYMWGRQLKKNDVRKAKQEMLNHLVHDIIAYHDSDGNELLAEEEILDALRQWCVLAERYRQLSAIDMDSPAAIKQAKKLEAGFLKDFGGRRGELQRLAAQPDSFSSHKTLSRFLEAAREEHEQDEGDEREEM